MTTSSPLSAIRDQLEVVLEALGLGVGMLAAVIVLWGVLRNVWCWAGLELRGSGRALSRHEERESARQELRRALGYYLLLGLEFLVAADVLETMLTPTPTQVLTLAGVVLLRTIIAFSLNWELGHESGSSGAHTRPSDSEAGRMGGMRDVATNGG